MLADLSESDQEFSIWTSRGTWSWSKIWLIRYGSSATGSGTCCFLFTPRRLVERFVESHREKERAFIRPLRRRMPFICAWVWAWQAVWKENEISFCDKLYLKWRQIRRIFGRLGLPSVGWYLNDKSSNKKVKLTVLSTTRPSTLNATWPGDWFE